MNTTDVFDVARRAGEPTEAEVAHLAEVAFNAYGQSTGGKTWDGKDIPPYAAVREKTPHVARAWEAAVRAVLTEVSR